MKKKTGEPGTRPRPRTRAKPLSGLRILVTRAQAQAEGLSSLLRKQGARVIEVPCIEIHPPRSWKPLDEALRSISDYDWLILTSVNGVASLFGRMKHLRVSKSRLAPLKVAAIGPATRDALEQQCVGVTCTPNKYIAEAVVAALRRRVQGKRVLLVRAAEARDVIPRELRSAGARIDVVAAYETRSPVRSRTRLGRLFRGGAETPDVVTFTSSSTAHNFARALGPAARDALRGRVALASIGPATSATLRELGLYATLEAKRYDMQGLVAAIVGWAKRHG